MYISDFANNVARNSVKRALTIIHSIWIGGPGWDIYPPSLLENVPENQVRSHRTMRRKVNGHWQYRAPTDDELSEHDAGRSW